MAILRTLYLYPSVPDDDTRIELGRLMSPFHEALNDALTGARLRAPFVKLAPRITLGPASEGSVYEGIAQVGIDDDPGRLLLDPRPERVCAEWTITAARRIGETLGWDASPLISLVNAIRDGRPLSATDQATAADAVSPADDPVPPPAKPGPRDLPEDAFWALIGRLDWSASDREWMVRPLIDALAR